ncbi:hypothetical protein FT663_03268 [Candidozyma haemuli var. vulneris]|uniref:Vacuolar protein sorting-associated protein 51 homolog n=1 Tax=Candidozyma haemuli TaxID=45357 RepID=A0A2V1AN87_9ASCO|nr:hypothetical protein CXQ85_003188 [[Candida] haemuloni]KAF3990224.1 hypothetical protein FT663_03268 [[Candida] haemuloni var. vulneris]KAF3990517.1 hypothetical protein FT662_02202 [[Candida] haemuloni var. vulneris]PVH19349.1 hypothetical protein CXQ85_003188 [[Candida] haemuloni]
MSSGASTPVLSYKKRSQKQDGKQSNQDANVGSRSPRISTQSLSSPVPGSSPSAPSTPTLGASRKVSSRRKALQDFYKLHSETPKGNESEQELSSAEPKEEKENEEAKEQAVSEDHASSVEELNDPKKIEEFIKTASASELLKIRNSASGKLNFHDSEKKSIIYDNYYELIKLNQVLSDLSGKEKKRTVLEEDQKEIITDEHLQNVMGELTNFLDTTASRFNQNFTSVVNDFSTEAKRSDSLASIQAIKDTN